MSAVECLLPSLEPDLYPVLAGPPAFYPAEPDRAPRVEGPWRADPAVQEVQERMAQAVRSCAWLEYFQARREWAELEEAGEPAMPPAEVTVLVGWPEGFLTPVGAGRLWKAAEAEGWEVRSGYSRAFRKGVRRGEYHRCHFVVIQAQRGSQRVAACWWAKADTEKLKWSWDRGMINGRHVDSVSAVSVAITTGGMEG